MGKNKYRILSQKFNGFIPNGLILILDDFNKAANSENVSQVTLLVLSKNYFYL
jgi:hypothetical protein